MISASVISSTPLSLGEALQSLSFFGSTNMVPLLVYGLVGIGFVIMNRHLFFGKDIKRWNETTKQLEDATEGGFGGLKEIASKIWNKRWDELKVEDGITIFKTLLYAALGIISLTTTIYALALIGGSFGIHLPGFLSGGIPGTIISALQSIGDFANQAIYPLMAITAALFVFEMYADVFNKRAKDSYGPMQKIRGFSIFMMAVPSFILAAMAFSDVIGSSFLSVLLPVVVVTGLFWMIFDRNNIKSSVKDVLKITGAAAMMLALSTAIPSTDIALIIVGVVQIAAAAGAAYMIYKSTQENDGIFKQLKDMITLENVKKEAPWMALRAATIALPIGLGFGLGYGVAGVTVGVLVALVHVSYEVYRAKNNLQEKDEEKTKLFMLAGSIAIFPALAGTAIGFAYESPIGIAVAIGSLTIAAIIGAGTMAATFKVKQKAVAGAGAGAGIEI